MSWQEFCSLLSGIMPDTPLGQIVQIRAEKDPKILKNFSKDQKRIKNEWAYRRNQKLREDPKAYTEYWSKFQASVKAMFL